MVQAFLFLLAETGVGEDRVVGTALGKGRFFVDGEVGDPFFAGFFDSVADGLSEGVFAELIEDEAGPVLGPVFIVAVLHVDVAAVA